MLWLLIVVLCICWALGFLVFKVSGALIHLLLVIAVIALLFRVIRGRPSA